jgi:hypothetical protein
MTNRHHLSIGLIAGALLLATVISAQSSEGTGGGPAPSASRYPSAPILGARPRGLVVVITYGFQTRRGATPVPSGILDLQALSNPYVKGVDLQIHWSDIERVQDTPDWSQLDELFAAAQSSNKWVQLSIYPGFFTPDWALKGVKTHKFTVPYGRYAGQQMSLPMPWDSVYLNRWFAFLKLVSARYGTSQAFRMIALDGPTSVSPEFTLPNSPTDLEEWQDQHYTPSKYLGAWQQVFKVYAADFPRQYCSLSAGTGLSINDKGKLDPSEHLKTRQDLVNEGIKALGRRFALEMDDVHAGRGAKTPNSQAEDQFIIGYNGRIVTGFQMKTSAEYDSQGMGAAGDPPLALQRSIDFAMEPNKMAANHRPGECPDCLGSYIVYLEIYEPDVLADEMQSVLRGAASLFEPPPAPAPAPVVHPS